MWKSGGRYTMGAFWLPKILSQMLACAMTASKNNMTIIYYFNKCPRKKTWRQESMRSCRRTISSRWTWHERLEFTIPRSASGCKTKIKVNHPKWEKAIVLVLMICWIAGLTVSTLTKASVWVQDSSDSQKLRTILQVNTTLHKEVQSSTALKPILPISKYHMLRNQYNNSVK